MGRSKKVKHIKKDKCRIIKIDKDALFEFVYETMIDRMEQYFDILDVTTITSHHHFNPETGEYICLIKDDDGQLPDDFDIGKLLSKMERTATSLYSPNRYREFSLDEIRKLLEKP